jgi:adenine-specific DNA methylase
MECSNKGTIQTAEMLIDAKNEEELAAIWIAATAKELYERRNEYKKSVGRYANILHMAACDFLRSRFYLWHHAMKSLVPNILISPSIIENIDCSDAAPVMGLIQTNTVLLNSSWSILRYSSLKDEDFPKARYRLNK